MNRLTVYLFAFPRSRRGEPIITQLSLVPARVTRVMNFSMLGTRSKTSFTHGIEQLASRSYRVYVKIATRSNASNRIKTGRSNLPFFPPLPKKLTTASPTFFHPLTWSYVAAGTKRKCGEEEKKKRSDRYCNLRLPIRTWRGPNVSVQVARISQARPPQLCWLHRATEFDVRGKFSCSGHTEQKHGSFSNREDTFYHRGNVASVGRKCVGPSTVPSKLKSQTLVTSSQQAEKSYISLIKPIFRFAICEFLRFSRDDGYISRIRIDWNQLEEFQRNYKFLFNPSFRPSRCRLKVSIIAANVVRKNRGKALEGKRASWYPFPRPTFHRDLASSTAFKVNVLPPTHRSFRFFTPLSIDPRLLTSLLSSPTRSTPRGIGTRPWISEMRAQFHLDAR